MYIYLSPIFNKCKKRDCYLEWQIIKKRENKSLDLAVNKYKIDQFLYDEVEERKKKEEEEEEKKKKSTIDP